VKDWPKLDRAYAIPLPVEVIVAAKPIGIIGIDAIKRELRKKNLFTDRMGKF
jgi:hypothetical protein